jgi:DNA-binding FrmR family transcriptional regulator
MNIQEKIKELGLVPLFPDYYYFNSSKKNELDTLKINSDDYIFKQTMRFERPLIQKYLYVSLEIMNDNFECEMHFVIDFLDRGGDKIYRDDYRDLKFDNLPDVLNFFNEHYESVAKVFNEMLMEKLKEELEEEKKKQEEKQKQDQEKAEQEKGKEEGEGEGEGEREGEGEGDGEGEGEGEGEPKEMTAEEIQKLLEELNKEEKGESSKGQSDNEGDEIDLEDFLEKVEKGEAENDFTKGYKDKELKDKIDYEKRGEKPEGEPDDMNFDLPDFPEPQTNSDKRIEGVLDAIVDMLNTDKEDIKRQFPTEKSAKSFVSLLSPNELDFIITQVGLSESLSRFEKQKLITSNFIIELENI